MKRNTIPFAWVVGTAVCVHCHVLDAQAQPSNDDTNERRTRQRQTPTDEQQGADPGAPTSSPRAGESAVPPPTSSTPESEQPTAPSPLPAAEAMPRSDTSPAPTTPPVSAGSAPTSETSATPAPAGPDPLEAELAQELSELQSPEATAAPPPASPAAPSAAAFGLSNTSNPAISATLSLLGGATTRGASDGADEEAAERDDLSTGIHLQEVELRASSIVDPYFRADVTLAGSEEEIGFEEAYVSTLALPRVTLRAGQMAADFGRHNPLHTHAYPFLTAPLPWRVLLGPEGLKDPGVSADVLLPLPFFVELNLQAFSGEWQPFEGEIEDDPDTAADEAISDRRKDADLAYLGRLTNLFELGGSTTAQLGGTYVGGRNGFGGITHVAGGDLTVKWRPIEAERYTGLNWTTEYLAVQQRRAPDQRATGGAYTSLAYQFMQRFWIQGRASLLGLPRGGHDRAQRFEGLLAFVPSEFSLLRLQYAYETADDLREPVHEVFLQLGASVGSHPAHAY